MLNVLLCTVVVSFLATITSGGGGSDETSGGIRCWQCAGVDGSICPNDAKLIDSAAHDACITWQLANGSVLFQNVVRFDEECRPEKIKFWSNFIDLYYKDSGGSVQCCSQPGKHSL